MSWKSVLHSDSTPWLLDGENPAVTAQALQHLEDFPRDDPKIGMYLEQVMAKLDIPKNPVIEQGIAQLVSLQTEQGRWVMKESLNGKMWVDVEQKGKPSRWLTLKVCEVLKKYIQ